MISYHKLEVYSVRLLPIVPSIFSVQHGTQWQYKALLHDGKMNYCDKNGDVAYQHCQAKALGPRAFQTFSLATIRQYWPGLEMLWRSSKPVESPAHRLLHSFEQRYLGFA